MKDKKIIIFGAGYAGRHALEHYGEDSIAFFCDNNPEKVGEIYCGKKIISFAHLKQIHSDYQIVVALLLVEMRLQITQQLKQNGIENYCMFTDDHIFYANKEANTIEIKDGKANYAWNKKLLLNYPYFFGKIPEFKLLQNELVNLDEDIPYFFKDLSKPLFIRNLSHPLHIKFLFDNVRASEDVAMENHIYLYYENELSLLKMLCKCDLKSLLKKQKFVFLSGKQNKKMYPLNFKKKYGIDYASMKFKPLRADELKRIIIYNNYNASGQDFLFQISAANKNILPIYAPNPCSYLPKLKNEVLFVDSNHSAIAANPKTFRNLSAALYNHREQGAKQRISPTILFDPHCVLHTLFNDVYESFTYKKSTCLIRNPIIRYASIIKCNFFNKGFAFAPTRLYNMVSELKTIGFKLEQLKENPIKGAKALSKFSQVPFDKNMLHPEKFSHIATAASITGKRVMGFEPTPKRDISEVLSEWDIQRLMPIWEPILQYYGYEYKKYAPLKETDLEQIYSEPFKFEELVKTDYRYMEDRRIFTKVLLNLYHIAKSGKYYLTPTFSSQQP